MNITERMIEGIKRYFPFLHKKSSKVIYHLALSGMVSYSFPRKKRLFFSLLDMISGRPTDRFLIRKSQNFFFRIFSFHSLFFIMPEYIIHMHIVIHQSTPKISQLSFEISGISFRQVKMIDQRVINKKTKNM